MGNEILGDDAELMQAAGGCSISYMLRRATDDPYEASASTARALRLRPIFLHDRQGLRVNIEHPVLPDSVEYRADDIRFMVFAPNV